MPGETDIRSRLLNAIADDDASAVKEVLKSLPAADRAAAMFRPIFDGRPLLQYALIKGGERPSVNAFKEILKFCNSDVLNTADNNGDLPAFMVLNAPVEYLDAMLDTENVNWGATNAKGDTPLSHALKNKDIAFNRRSFSRLAELHPQVLYRLDKSGNNIVHAACNSGSAEKFVFAADLPTLIAKNNPRCVRDSSDLLSHKNGMGQTPVHVLYDTCSQPLESLGAYIKSYSPVQKKVDLLAKDSEGKSAIYKALERDDLEIYEFCQPGSDPDRAGEFFVSAAELNNQEAVNKIIDSQELDPVFAYMRTLLKEDPQRLVKCINSDTVADDFWNSAYNSDTYTHEDRAALLFCIAASDEHHDLLQQLTQDPDDTMLRVYDFNEMTRSFLNRNMYLQNPDLFFKVGSNYIDLDIFTTEGVMPVVRANSAPDTLQEVLNSSQVPELANMVSKAMSQRDCFGTSIIGKAISTCDKEKIPTLLHNVLQYAQQYATTDIARSLKEEICRSTIDLAAAGDTDKILAVLKVVPDAVYSEEPKSGRSVLEVASDSGNTQATYALLEFHKKVCRDAEMRHSSADLQRTIEHSIAQVARVNPEAAGVMAVGILNSDKHISLNAARRILQYAAPTNRGTLENALKTVHPSLTEEILPLPQHKTSKSVAELYEPKQSSTTGDLAPDSSATSDDRALQNYGLLYKYADMLESLSSDAHKFKKEIAQDFKTLGALRQTSFPDKKGHSLFTLAAMHGVPAQMDIVVSRFNDARRENLAFRADYKKISSLGSPLQCAIKGNNVAMTNYLLGKMKSSEICSQYGSSEDNLIHTLIKTGNLDTLFSLPHTTQSPTRSSSRQVIQAISQRDAEGRTPVDVAFSMGEESCSAMCAFISTAISEQDIERLLVDGSIMKQALTYDSPSALKWVFDLADGLNSQRRAQNRGKKINILGNERNLQGLVEQAAKNNNPDVHSALLDRIKRDYIGNDAGLQSLCQRLLVNMAENNVYNAELFKTLSRFAAEPDRESSDYLDYNALLIQHAVSHDNPNLIAHVSNNPGFEWPDGNGLLKDSKDNMLAFLLETERVFTLDDDLIPEIVKPGLMPNACEAYINTLHMPRLQTERGHRMLYCAIEAGNEHAIEALLRHNFDVLICTQNAGPDAQERTQNLIYDIAVKTCPNNEAGKGVLRYLAHQTVNALLEEDKKNTGFVPNSEFSYTLRSILLRYNPDLNAEDLETLKNYTETGTYNVMQRRGTDNLLRIALESRNLKEAEKLLEDHATYLEAQQDVGGVDDIINELTDGCSILHLAALHGNHKILNRLIELGGDPSIPTSQGENVAHLCARSGMKTDDGRYVFEALITNSATGDKRLNTVDQKGMGILAHASRCSNESSTTEMLELIRKKPELDSQLGTLSSKSDKKGRDFFYSTVGSASLERRDSAISAFIASDSGIHASAQENTLLRELKKAEGAKAVDKMALTNLLTSLSLQSHTEVQPLEPAKTVVGGPRKLLVHHQKTLFDIVNSTSIGQNDLEHLHKIPMDAFVAKNWKIGMSPIEHAIAVKNLDFIGYLLRHRADDLRPNVCNTEGDNLPVQLSKLVAEDATILEQNSDFAELYGNLLKQCNCTTQSRSHASVIGALERIEGHDDSATLTSLREESRTATNKESELKHRLLSIESELQRSYYPGVVNSLAQFVRENPAFARNSANTFHTLFSNAISDAVSTRSLTDAHRSYIKELIKNSDTRSLLANVDHNGNNALQSVLQELSESKVGIGIAKADVLQEILAELLVNLGKEDQETLRDVLLKHRNANGDNCVEMLASVNPSYDLFRAIETKLSSNSIADFCDLNTILVRAASQGALQRHIYENYAVFPIGGCDIEQNSRIHNATVSGDYGAFIAAMQTGSNINQTDKNGNTPIHSLLIHLVQNRGDIKSGHLKILETLVSHGAALHHKNNDNLSACDIAKDLEGSLFEPKNGCLQLLAQHRLRYHELKRKTQEEVEKNFVKSSGGRKLTQPYCDISGAIVAVKLGNETLLVSKLLNSGFCNDNSLSRAQFSFNEDQDQGYVEKVGNKRNYTVTEGIVRLNLTWKPTQGKEQKVSVAICADGTIKVEDNFIQKCGEKGERLNFNNCKVFVGGFSLEDALRSGVWKNVSERSAGAGIDRSVEHSAEQGMGPAPESPGSTMEQRTSGDAGTSAHIEDPVEPIAADFQHPQPATVTEPEINALDYYLRNIEGRAIQAHESVEAGVQEWADIVNICHNLELHYSFDASEESNVSAACASFKATHAALVAEQSVLESLIKNDDLATHVGDSIDHGTTGIRCTYLGKSTDAVQVDSSGAVKFTGSGAVIPTNCTSPYGFGNKLDAEIKDSLEFIKTICDNVQQTEYEIKLPAIEYLPMLAVAVRDARNQLINNKHPDDLSLSEGKRALEFVADTVNDYVTKYGSQLGIVGGVAPGMTGELAEEHGSGVADYDQSISDYASDVSSEEEIEAQPYAGNGQTLLWDYTELGGDIAPLGETPPIRTGGIPIADIKLPPSSNLSEKTAAILRELGVQDSSNALAAENAEPLQSASGTERAWNNVVSVCERAGHFYAFDVPTTANVEQFSNDLLLEYSKIESAQQGGNNAAQVDNAIVSVAQKHNVRCAVLGTELKIQDSEVQHGLERGFSSPYGFGHDVDQRIQSSLETMQKIARISNTNLNVTIQRNNLPGIVSAVNTVKNTPPSGMQFPDLESETSISQDHGRRILMEIMNEHMLNEGRSVTAMSHYASGSVREKVQYFEKRGSMSADVATEPESHEPTTQQFFGSNTAALKDLSASTIDKELEDAAEGLASMRQDTSVGAQGSGPRMHETGQQSPDSQLSKEDVGEDPWTTLQSCSEDISALTLEGTSSSLPMTPTHTPSTETQKGGPGK
ncbi:ankyrin repeat domain-containing protein [Anaplasma capra]|uniref:hypothetical protein n=1 Tax=Anaplasma capra TaxID=1562740 RepID=UPI0021D5B103|nr:hypothetical protein [Anaplasma capra]MCU7612221.1 hypothetical protein [Anaplasma capra]